MPPSKKQSNKKKGVDGRKKKKPPFNPRNKKCFYCNAEPPDSNMLHDCSRCGMASYCNKQCQLAAYPEHKEWCKQTSNDYPADDTKGKRRILFSRKFGGAVSLLMKEGHRRYGKGLIFASCSHPFKEYCGRRRSEDKRSIKLSYISEGEQVRRLQEQVLGDSQPKEDGEGSGLLEIATECNDAFCEHCSDLSNGRCCVVALEQEGVKFIHPVHFVQYMSLDHPAHDWFRKILQVDPREEITLNWDWDSTSSGSEEDEDHPLQWLYQNAIGPIFYRQCSEAWQEKRRNADRDNYSPWPGGVVTPPLALEIGMQKLNTPLRKLM